MNHRIMSTEEFQQLQEALKDPDYLKNMLADVKRNQMVEVDNPFRTELRPRRGTNE